MAEYIEREALIAAYDKAHKGPPGGARKLMEEAPAADVAPVKRGRWLYSSIKNPMFRVCDQCACAAVKLENQSEYNYGPFCGAKMEVEQ